MYVLDTNICIFVLKNRSNQLRHKFKATKNLAISSVTYGELCYGIENGEGHLKKQRWEQLDTFTQRLFIEPWDKDAADECPPYACFGFSSVAFNAPDAC